VLLQLHAMCACGLLQGLLQLHVLRCCGVLALVLVLVLREV
jgi:hypothetical protein